MENLTRKILADAGLFDYELRQINVKDLVIEPPSYQAIVTFTYEPPVIGEHIWERIMEKYPALLLVNIELPIRGLVVSHLELMYWQEEE